MRWLAVMIPLFLPAAAAAQPPGGGWPSPLPITVGPPAAPPVPDGVPPRVIEVIELPEESMSNGQQHWLSVNFALGQPSVGRVGVKILNRENNSLWLEAYGGGALYEAMYGFGARLQHTAVKLGRGDSFLISPGLGVNIFPDWYATHHELHYNRRHGYWRTGETRYSTLYFLAGDVDFSWLHDFTPRFGFELGAKLGLAGRLGGDIGDCYPSGVMWGKNLYPIAAFYSGFRF